MLPGLSARRVLMTTDAVGGVWRYSADLSNGLAARGHAVTLAVLGPAPDDAQRAELEDVALRVTGRDLEWTAPDAACVREAAETVARLAEDADIVHLNTPALAAFGLIGPPIVATCHSCVATWWDAVRGGAMPDDLRWRHGLVAAGYRRARRLIAPSAAFAAATQAAYGVRPRVVHNGSDMVVAASGLPARAAFTAARLWDDGKDMRLLDDAAALLDFPVEAAGASRAPDGSEIVLPHLQLLGRLDGGAIQRKLAERPVFVSTARYEPFGLAVLEAARGGCALVLADIAPFRELWDGAADFVTGRDPAIWAEAIAHAVEGTARRAERGARARHRAGRYGIDAMVEQTLALYGEVLARVQDGAAA